MLVICVHPTKTTSATNELIISFPCKVGSAKTNDIVVNHPSVMPQHLIIEKRDTLLVVRELSNSGLTSEGRKMPQLVLGENKTIMVGAVRMDFLINTKPSKALAQTQTLEIPVREAEELTQKLPAQQKPTTQTAGGAFKFLVLAAIAFAVLKLNSGYVRQAEQLLAKQPVPGTAASIAENIASDIAAAREENSRALKELAPEITDTTGPATMTDAEPKTKNVAPDTEPPASSANPATTDSKTPIASNIQPTSLLGQLSPLSVRPARTAPEKALSLITSHDLGRKVFVLIAWAMLLGGIVRLRSPETPLTVPTFRAICIFGLLLVGAHGLRDLMPILNFNIDNHESFIRVASLLVIALGAFAFQALMLFVMPEDSFQKKTVLAAGLTMASSWGFHKAVASGSIALENNGLPFKGTVAMPIRSFPGNGKSAEKLFEAMDKTFKKLEP